MAANNELIIKWLTGEVKPSVFDAIHHSIHHGQAFTGGFLFSGSGAGALQQILIMNGADDLNFLYAVQSGVDAYVTLVERPAVLTSGTQLNLYNRDRNSGKSVDARLFASPTISGGVYFPTTLVPGGSGPNAAGGQIHSNDEWLLMPNTSYVLLVRNVSAQADHISVGVELYSEVGEAA